MAFLKRWLGLCTLLHCLFPLLHLGNCDVDLEELFKGFNIYRNSQDRSVLTQNSKAKCIAEQIAKNWYNQLPCSRAINGDALLPSNQSQLPLFTQYSRKCKVNLNHTVDGIILPVYVPNSAEKLMLTNCTHSQAPKYLGSATYTRVGLATNEDCLVIALGTDAIGGSYSAGAKSFCFLSFFKLGFGDVWWMIVSRSHHVMQYTVHLHFTQIGTAS
ncbi:unnamed protein product [Citrullus colocynthis]|uniref:Uncharacterized GPI-anchored protein At5g19230-like domain-containing protein n=1 Tax=Citrullus colocynthis TaxID=252529 RepID=A0ABP0Y7T7_9ROSI